MRALAKVGFSQSYTYFTWKNTRWELREYVEHLAAAPTPEYLRPNFFVNTPDILSEYLQNAGPAGFASRLVLAATLSPSYGLYSGFEHFEALPRHPGSRGVPATRRSTSSRSATSTDRCSALLGRLNEIRRAHPALQRFENVRFLETENDDAARLRQARGRRRDPRRRHARPGAPPGGAARDRPASSGCRRPSRSTTCSAASATPGSAGATTSASTRRARSRTCSRWRRHERRRRRRPRPGARQARGRHARRADDAARLEPRPHAAPRARRGERAAARPSASPSSGSSPTRCGSSRRPSTRSTCAASSTATATAPATSAG